MQSSVALLVSTSVTVCLAFAAHPTQVQLKDYSCFQVALNVLAGCQVCLPMFCNLQTTIVNHPASNERPNRRKRRRSKSELTIPERATASDTSLPGRLRANNIL
jgi:hypothetical protein